jgi:hypothetical protein
LRFTFDGMPVGVFAYPPPRVAGVYSYVPFRGPGHYEMQERLRSGGSPRCAYHADDGGEITFRVVECPSYGELRLDQFESASFVGG